MTKTRITLAIDEDARQLIDRYAGKRAIGRFFADLVKRHHFEECFGTEMIRKKLDRLEDRLINFLDRSEKHINDN